MNISRTDIKKKNIFDSTSSYVYNLPSLRVAMYLSLKSGGLHSYMTANP